jgi:hypothetical protein
VGLSTKSRGGKTVVWSTAPLHSSIIRSQLASLLHINFICSFASICQVSWGVAARSALALGRRPAGAGDRSARANHRWSVRSVGTGHSGAASSSCTRISAAPQVGCARRRSRAARTASGGAAPAAGLR